MSNEKRFCIETQSETVRDAEIAALLTEVYVGGGFTSNERAAVLFVPSAVRARGILISARTPNGVFAGMVIVVRPDSSARRIAEPDEAEIHLLGVDLRFRQHGLGRQLMQAAIETSDRLGFQKIILWTQPSMTAAQRLYESLGFQRITSRDPVLDGTPFLAYGLTEFQRRSI